MRCGWGTCFGAMVLRWGVRPGFISREISEAIVEHAMVQLALLADERWAIPIPTSMSFLQAWGTVVESGRRACTRSVVFSACAARVSSLFAYGCDVSPELTFHAASRLPFVLDYVDFLVTDR